jgi:hypothetical protein
VHGAPEGQDKKGCRVMGELKNEVFAAVLMLSAVLLVTFMLHAALGN